jgi:hypothetical protein
MAMRAAVRFRRRARKEFEINVIGLLVAYAAIAAVLAFGAGVPLRGVLIFGAILVPAAAAVITVLRVGVGGVDDPHAGGSRPYDYDPGSDPVLRSGAGYGASGGGGYDYSGHGGADAGGW